VIGCDETGARVDGHTHWQWVFETPQASYHLIVPSRGSQAIAQVLGAAQPQVWVSDCFSAQLQAPAQHRQLCLAHQLRDLQYGVDAERCVFCYDMQQLLRRAQRLGKHRQRLSAQRFATQTQEIERACDALLAGAVTTRTGQRLRKRYLKHRGALFTFLQRSDVPPDNNACERALRHGVVHRKVSGGFRSDWGAEAFATLATVLQTAQKQGQEALATLHSVLGPPLDLNLLPQPP
jgi:transposase